MVHVKKPLTEPELEAELCAPIEPYCVILTNAPNILSLSYLIIDLNWLDKTLKEESDSNSGHSTHEADLSEKVQRV